MARIKNNYKKWLEAAANLTSLLGLNWFVALYSKLRTNQVAAIQTHNQSETETMPRILCKDRKRFQDN